METGLMGRLAQLLAMLLIGGGALYLVFRDVEWTAFRAELAAVDPWVFAAGLALFFGLHLCRSVRWGRLVQTVKPDVSFRSYFSICSIGFFLINVLPFRIGEVVRPSLLAEREAIPLGSGAATVLVERVLDVLALAALFGCVLLFADMPTQPVQVGDRTYDVVVLARTTILSALIPFGGGLTLFLLLGDRGIALARRVFAPFGARLSGLVVGFLSSFLSAVRSLGSVRALASVGAWTAAAWGINAASMWVMARAFPFGATMGYWEGAALLVVLCIVLIIPPPPGFAGVFEGGVAIGMTLLGHTMAEAAAFGVLVHVTQFVMLASLGTWFLVSDRVPIRSVLRASFDPDVGAGAGEAEPV